MIQHLESVHVANYSVRPSRIHPVVHQQPEVDYLPLFSPQLISLERCTLSVYCAGEIDLLENLDLVHIRLLVDARNPGRIPGACVHHAFRPCIFQSRATPLGRSHYPTSEFPITSESPPSYLPKGYGGWQPLEGCSRL